MNRNLTTERELKLAIDAFFLLHDILDVQINGNAIGEIGERYAKLNYNLSLKEKLNEKDADAEEISTGLGVQIKTHAREDGAVNFPVNPVDRVLIFFLNENHTFTEVYNGPYDFVIQHYNDFGGKRKGPLNFKPNAFNCVPLRKNIMMKLNEAVPPELKVKKITNF